MLETAGIPALMKAIDFLFQEGSKILQERRERRLMQEQQASKDAPIVKEIKKKQKHYSEKLPAIQRTILNAKVDEKKWLSREGEIRHLLELLEIFSRNYYLAKEQYSKWGSALVPSIVVHNLTEAEDSIADTLVKLRISLMEIYKAEITIPELDMLISEGRKSA